MSCTAPSIASTTHHTPHEHLRCMAGSSPRVLLVMHGESEPLWCVRGEGSCISPQPAMPRMYVHEPRDDVIISLEVGGPFIWRWCPRHPRPKSPRQSCVNPRCVVSTDDRHRGDALLTSSRPARRAYMHSSSAAKRPPAIGQRIDLSVRPPCRPIRQLTRNHGNHDADSKWGGSETGRGCGEEAA